MTPLPTWPGVVDQQGGPPLATSFGLSGVGDVAQPFLRQGLGNLGYLLHRVAPAESAFAAGAAAARSVTRSGSDTRNELQELLPKDNLR